VPAVISTRKTKLPKIVRYRMTGSQLLDRPQPLDYLYLPLVFFDGNSVMTNNDHAGGVKQYTRPYVYHARDAQRLKNFSGQTLANELENITAQKWIAPLEGIPKDYKNAYLDPQSSPVLIYQAFKDDNPDFRVPPPAQATRTPIPPEVSNTFVATDKLIQTVLGSYDAALGINGNQLSGKAILTGAMHSNLAAEPYMNGFIVSWNRLAQIALDLIPKYYVTPRTIPVVKPDGSREYVMINTPQGIEMKYNPHDLEITVEAGVSFSAQKTYALEMFTKLMSASPTFAEFINQKGLPMLLDNLDMRGIEALKLEVDEWLQQRDQQQQQMQQMAEQNNPIASNERIEMAKLQQKTQAEMREDEIKAAQLATDEAIKNKELDIDAMKAMADIKDKNYKTFLDAERVDAENTRSAIDLAINVAKHVEG